MRTFSILFVRELKATVTSFGFYVLAAAVMSITAFKFCEALEYYGNEMGQALLAIYEWPLFITMVVAPLLTMRLIADERRSGSWELLMTAPVSDRQVVAAKYAAAAVVYFAFIAPLWIFHGVLWAFFDATPDWGLLIGVTCGTLLTGLLFLAVGMFTSALTSLQLWAALMAFMINTALWLVGRLATFAPPGSSVRRILDYVSLDQQIRTFHNGLIDLRHVVFLLSLTAFVLFATTRIIESRRWR